MQRGCGCPRLEGHHEVVTIKNGGNDGRGMLCAIWAELRSKVEKWVGEWEIYGGCALDPPHRWEIPPINTIE